MIDVPQGTWADLDGGRAGPFWIGPTKSSADGSIVGVIFVCSGRHMGRIPLNRSEIECWTVDASGALSPSVQCTEAGCAFHEYVRLVGWEATP